VLAKRASQKTMGPRAVSPLQIEFSFDLLWSSFATLWPTLKPMIVGGAIIGTVIGAILYFLVRSAVLVSRSLREARLQAAIEARSAGPGEGLRSNLADTDSMAANPSPGDGTSRS